MTSPVAGEGIDNIYDIDDPFEAVSEPAINSGADTVNVVVSVVDDLNVWDGSLYMLGDGDDAITLTSSLPDAIIRLKVDGGTGQDTVDVSGAFKALYSRDESIEYFRIHDLENNSLDDGKKILVNDVEYMELTTKENAYLALSSYERIGSLSVNGDAYISMLSIGDDILGDVSSDDGSLSIYVSSRTLVTGKVSLNGGDDVYGLETTDLSYVPPQSVDGGAGFDALFVVPRGMIHGTYGLGDLDLDLSIYTGFEILTDGGSQHNGTRTFRNGSGFEQLFFSGGRVDLIDIVSPNSLVMAWDTNVDVSSGSVLGRFAPPRAENPDFDSYTELATRVYADGGILYSTTLTNHGTFLGDVQLTTGSDLLDTTDGRIHGSIYAYSGSDKVLGSAVSDICYGGYGNDHLIGAAGDDRLFGEAEDDILEGGLGNDLLDGGVGLDTAIYHVARAQATITRGADGKITVNAGLEGVDTLAGVERVAFADGLVAWSAFGDADPLLIGGSGGSGGLQVLDCDLRHVGDVNGDGYADLLGFFDSGVLVSYGLAGGIFGIARWVGTNFGQTAGWTSDDAFHRELADVNGDGRSDIVGFGFGGTLVSLGRADGTFADPLTGAANFGTAQGWTSQTGFARTMGDVDGDGNADIIGFGAAGTLVALGNGDGTFGTAALRVADFGVAQGWSNDTSFHRTVADVDGDGYADIVGFGAAGTLVALSNGDGTFETARLVLDNFGAAQGWSNQDAFARAVADVNGDGMADIVGFGAGGTFVAYGLEDGTFSAASFDVENFGQAQGWTSDTSFHRTLADINNDGFSDIVGFGSQDVFVAFSVGDVLIL